MQAECPVSEAPRAAEAALGPVSLWWVALAVVCSFVLGCLNSCAARGLIQFVTPRRKAPEADVVAAAGSVGVGALRRRPALASASGVGSLAVAGTESD